MSYEIKKVYKQSIPAFRFIGTKHIGNFNGLHKDDWDNIAKIEKSIGKPLNEIYEDGDAYCVLVKEQDEKWVEWYFGIFCPIETEVPDNTFYRDFSQSMLGVCWIYGQENDVTGRFNECKQALKNEGFDFSKDEDESIWYFERDTCPRFTTPDEKGNVISDYCFIIEEKIII
jgi:hypothetical protein